MRRDHRIIKLEEDLALENWDFSKVPKEGVKIARAAYKERLGYLKTRYKRKLTPEEQKKDDAARRRMSHWFFIDKEKERAAKWRAENKEHYSQVRKARRDKKVREYRAKERELKRRQRDKRGEEINEYQRKNYEENKEERREQIYANRIRREPYRGIRKAANEYLSGDKPIGELTRLINERLALANSVYGGSDDSGQE